MYLKLMDEDPKEIIKFYEKPLQIVFFVRLEQIKQKSAISM